MRKILARCDAKYEDELRTPGNEDENPMIIFEVVMAVHLVVTSTAGVLLIIVVVALVVSTTSKVEDGVGRAAGLVVASTAKVALVLLIVIIVALVVASAAEGNHGWERLDLAERHFAGLGGFGGCI
jgi:hypothetical protein